MKQYKMQILEKGSRAYWPLNNCQDPKAYIAGLSKVESKQANGALFLRHQTKIVKAIPLLFLFLLIGFSASAQEDSLFDELDAMTEIEKTDVIAAFKSTRVILAPSIERVQKKQLHFRVSHLFSPISLGYRELFGLDQLVNMNLSLEYGINNRVQVGLARPG